MAEKLAGDTEKSSGDTSIYKCLNCNGELKRCGIIEVSKCGPCVEQDPTTDNLYIKINSKSYLPSGESLKKSGDAFNDKMMHILKRFGEDVLKLCGKKDSTNSKEGSLLVETEEISEANHTDNSPLHGLKSSIQNNFAQLIENASKKTSEAILDEESAAHKNSDSLIPRLNEELSKSLCNFIDLHVPKGFTINSEMVHKALLFAKMLVPGIEMGNTLKTLIDIFLSGHLQPGNNVNEASQEEIVDKSEEPMVKKRKVELAEGQTSGHEGDGESSNKAPNDDDIVGEGSSIAEKVPTKATSSKKIDDKSPEVATDETKNDSEKSQPAARKTKRKRVKMAEISQRVLRERPAKTCVDKKDNSRPSTSRQKTKANPNFGRNGIRLTESRFKFVNPRNYEEVGQLYDIYPEQYKSECIKRDANTGAEKRKFGRYKLIVPVYLNNPQDEFLIKTISVSSDLGPNILLESKYKPDHVLGVKVIKDPKIDEMALNDLKTSP